MNKRIIWALILMALAVVVLIFNKGDCTVNLLFTRVEALKSLIFLAFLGLGVAIGALLR